MNDLPLDTFNSLGAYPVWQDWGATLGEAIVVDGLDAGSRGVRLHPLDVIAIKYSNPYDRLDAAMAEIVRHFHVLLDAVALKLEREMEVSR